MRVILHAPNVHQGGGRTLLLSLLRALSNTESIAIIDQRLRLPSDPPDSIQILRVQPTVRGRLLAEKTLASVSRPEDTVLCFGNLPPLFGNRGKVSVFLQNRYLLRRRNTKGLDIIQRLRIELERLWLRSFLGKADLIVQTDSMAREAVAVLHNSRVKVMPFVPTQLGSPCATEPLPPKYDFLYVASGEPHKNHRRLVEAWELLGAAGLFPSLCLTLDEVKDDELIEWIFNKASASELRIVNTGNVSATEIEKLYAESGALIYPSLFESFGLPLIEASNSGLPLVAAELDYVRDVSNPVQTFEPNSAVSIARAVKRHLGHHAAFIHPTSADFMHSLINQPSQP